MLGEASSINKGRYACQWLDTDVSYQSPIRNINSAAISKCSTKRDPIGQCTALACCPVSYPWNDHGQSGIAREDKGKVR